MPGCGGRRGGQYLPGPTVTRLTSTVRLGLFCAGHAGTLAKTPGVAHLAMSEAPLVATDTMLSPRVASATTTASERTQKHCLPPLTATTTPPSRPLSSCVTAPPNRFSTDTACVSATTVEPSSFARPSAPLSVPSQSPPRADQQKLDSLCCDCMLTEAAGGKPTREVRSLRPDGPAGSSCRKRAAAGPTVTKVGISRPGQKAAPTPTSSGASASCFTGSPSSHFHTVAELAPTVSSRVPSSENARCSTTKGTSS